MINAEQEEAPVQGYKFGTFGGVFTPSILTIFGLIMFMRTNYVVGQMGIGLSLVILGIAASITLSTGLSIAVISTNTPVKGGGAYYLISRALGPAFGSSIGVTLYLAQTLSVPFYLLGFAEAVATNIPLLKPLFLELNLLPALLLFFLAWKGADWAIKTQYFILAVLAISIFSFLGGAAFVPFTVARFQENFGPALPRGNFFYYFAVFFPAVTGIMAGVNMSGDLKHPRVSIPRGTLWAIFVSSVVYALEIILCGGAFSREEMIARPYETLVRNALFGSGFLVFAGVVAATISSALGSLLGAPRILQALAKDQIIRPLNIFAAGHGTQNEPRRAMVLTLAVTLAVLIWGGWSGMPGSTGGSALNLVAEVVTMFFLYTYSIVNLAAFVESFGANPSFRPRFRFFHWSASLYGALACFAASLMINAVISLVALTIMTILFLIVRHKSMEMTFGDARRGFVYARLRDNLLQLVRLPVHQKNWRPTIVILSGDPQRQHGLVEYAGLFGDRRGILSLLHIVEHCGPGFREKREAAVKHLSEIVAQYRWKLFPEAVVAEDFDIALRTSLQAHSLGPLKPNIVMFGWPHNIERVVPFFSHIRTVFELNMNCLLLVNPRGIRVPLSPTGTIDVWWRGQGNGSLMLIMAYLLSINYNWSSTRIRLLRFSDGGDRTGQEEEMHHILDAARIDGEVKIIASEKGFIDAFRHISRHATVVFTGFLPPVPEDGPQFYEEINQRLEGMPPTFLVASNGEADLLA